MPELRGEDWIERHEAVVGAQQEPSSKAVIAVLPVLQGLASTSTAGGTRGGASRALAVAVGSSPVH